MIRRLGRAFERFFRATAPDPFVLAILLTLLAFALAAAVEGRGPIEIVRAWQGDKGFWSLLRFSMQMTLILVTGHALASAPVIARAIAALARLPRTGAQCVWLVSTLAMATALLNWGLGLVVGALLARAVGRSAAERGVRAHYPLLAAAGYTGLLCWHGGFSGTAPLKMTRTEDVERFLGPELARDVELLPLTETVLSPLNLLITGGLLVIVPLLCAALAPRQADAAEPVDAFSPAQDPTPDDGPRDSLADRIETSPVLTACIVLPLALAIGVWAHDVGIARMDPNALNLLFLTLGLALHGTVRRYVRAVGEAVRGAAGIVLQFPFYAGIMGVMRGTGLGATFAQSMSSVASTKLYTTLTMGSAALINLFVPSGGGQWAVQGPIAAEASMRLGVPLEVTVMAVAYGDQLTNMLQPFWALPLLAITGVRARDIVGYTALVMIVAGSWMAGCLAALTP